MVKWLASVSPYRSTRAVNKELDPSGSVLPDGSVYLIVGYTGLEFSSLSSVKPTDIQPCILQRSFGIYYQLCPKFAYQEVGVCNLFR